MEGRHHTVAPLFHVQKWTHDRQVPLDLVHGRESGPFLDTRGNPHPRGRRFVVNQTMDDPPTRREVPRT